MLYTYYLRVVPWSLKSSGESKEMQKGLRIRYTEYKPLPVTNISKLIYRYQTLPSLLRACYILIGPVKKSAPDPAPEKNPDSIQHTNVKKTLLIFRKNLTFRIMLCTHKILSF